MPEKLLLKAKFRGTDGSMGFKKGLNYNISFERPYLGTMPNQVEILTTTKPLLKCEYSSVETFFDNWTDIKPR